MFDHFDLAARFYDRVFGRSDTARLIELLQLPGDGRILDVAGGTARVLTGMSAWRGLSVLCDSSHAMLRQAQKKRNAAPLRSAAERLPLADGAFQRIFMVDALHHVADQQRTLQEMWRVLAPGGRLVVEEYDIDHWAIKLVALAEKMAFMRSHFLPIEEIVALLRRDDAMVQVVTNGREKAWIIADKR
ncbi:methyltransferase domain-containing protein [candidate division KSB1 bacterium]|nr:methyltransferase domain-containing protein [candidate division KSB1 bacterium]